MGFYFRAFGVFFLLDFFFLGFFLLVIIKYLLGIVWYGNSGGGCYISTTGISHKT